MSKLASLQRVIRGSIRAPPLIASCNSGSLNLSHITTRGRPHLDLIQSHSWAGGCTRRPFRNFKLTPVIQTPVCASGNPIPFLLLLKAWDSGRNRNGFRAPVAIDGYSRAPCTTSRRGLAANNWFSLSIRRRPTLYGFPVIHCQEHLRFVT